MPDANEPIFVYRDVFFRLSGYYLVSETGKVAGTWDHRPALSEIRKACEIHVEWLISNSIYASGDVSCEECGKPLRSHPYFHGAFAFGNEGPYLHRRCDGVLVKL